MRPAFRVVSPEGFRTDVLSKLSIDPNFTLSDSRYFQLQCPLEIYLDHVQLPFGVDRNAFGDPTNPTFNIAVSGVKDEWVAFMRELESHLRSQLVSLVVASGGSAGESQRTLELKMANGWQSCLTNRWQKDQVHVRLKVTADTQWVDGSTAEVLTHLPHGSYRQHPVSVDIGIRGGYRLPHHRYGLILACQKIIVYPPTSAFSSQQWVGVRF